MALANSASRVLQSPVLIGLLIALCLVAASVNQGMLADEGTWHYIGQSMVEGAKPYIGAYDAHPPGIFYIFALSHRLAGVNYWLTRLFGVAALVVASYVMFRVGALLHSRLAGASAMLLFGLTMANPAAQGPATTLSETYMVLTTVLAIYWLVKSRDAAGRGGRVAYLFLAGLMLGLSMFLFKQPAVFSAIGAVVFYLTQRRYSRTPTRAVPDIAVAVLGSAVALGLVLGVLAAEGVGPGVYLHAVILDIPKAGLSNHWLGGRLLGFFRAWQAGPLVLYAPFLAVFAIQPKSLANSRVPFWGIVAWAVLDFLGANSGGFYYPHQLKQAVPMFALAGGLGLANAVKVLVPDAESAARWQAAAVLVLALIWTPFEMLVTPAVLRRTVDAPRQLGLWANQRTEPTDTLWAVGDDGGGILAWSGRRCTSRYTTFIGQSLPGAQDEMIRDFAARPPKFIFMPTNEDERPDHHPVPAWFQTLLDRDYHVCASRLNYLIFERGPAPAAPPPATPGAKDQWHEVKP